MNFAGTSPRQMAGGPVTIRPARDEDAPGWDALVSGRHEGTFFHRFGWRNIFRDIFRLEPQYLVAEREGVIAGILPLVHQKSLLFGNVLIAVPFCVEGGPLAVDGETRNCWIKPQLDLMDELKAQSLEFRSRIASRTGWTARKHLYATFSRELSASDEDNLRAIPRKQRAVVRKTLQGDLSSHLDGDVEALFRVYSESVRNLGTPVFPKRYFARLLADLRLRLRHRGHSRRRRTFECRDELLFSGHGDALLWRWADGGAAQRGQRLSLLGSDAPRGSMWLSPFRFRTQQGRYGCIRVQEELGFRAQWLEYEFYLAPGAALPEKNPNNPKYAGLIAMWKRLPLPIANLIGPHLVRGLG